MSLRHAHKKGQLVEFGERKGVVIDVQYPQGTGDWCWVAVMWDNGKVCPHQPTRTFRLIEERK